MMARAAHRNPATQICLMSKHTLHPDSSQKGCQILLEEAMIVVTRNDSGIGESSWIKSGVMPGANMS